MGGEHVSNRRRMMYKEPDLQPIGVDLIDPTTITQGYYVNSSTGQLTGWSGFRASDYIPVYAGYKYVFTTTVVRNNQYALYNMNKEYLSGVQNDTLIKTISPSQNGYIRVSASTVTTMTLVRSE